MKLINSPFGAVGHSLALTLEAARASGDKYIEIPYGEYDIYKEDCAHTVLCVSNHGHNGYKSAALVIEDFDGLTVDGNGSVFNLHGCMDFAIVNNSKNITIKNLTVKCPDVCNFQGKVIESSPEMVKIDLGENHPKLYRYGYALFEDIEHEKVPFTRTLEYDPATKKIRRGLGDDNFGKPFFNSFNLKFEGEVLCIPNVPVPPVVGNVIVFCISRRIGQAFLAAKSENVTFENITVNTCWGMAFIAQKCTTVTIRGCKVTPDGDNCWSAGQDASHFVNCRGKVTIEDNLFENQLDDAVNFHGIYTQIEKIADNKLLVAYKHWQTVGIDIYSKGDRIQMLEQDSQMPVAEAIVTDVEVLNNYKTVLTLDNLSEKVTEGMIVESLDDNAEALIQNNIIRNNRARGMLLASKGKTVVRNNHFNSGGAAIQFESDPFRWFECGGTRDVLIEDNLFDDCKYGKWGRAVIDIGKRRRNVDGFYYHGKIEIKNNRFTQTDCPCVAADNVGELIFDDSNAYVSEVSVVPAHCVWNGVKYE